VKSEENDLSLMEVLSWLMGVLRLVTRVT